MNRMKVDARNLRCPLPLLKLKQSLANIQVNDEVEIFATDAGSWRDIPAFVALTQHKIIEQNEADGEFHFVILKGE